MITTKYHWLYLLAITLFVNLFFLFYFRSNLYTLVANYDGPNYIVIAKCGYDPDCIRHNFSLPLPLEYYPAHLPGYPLLINLVSNFIITPQAIILLAILGSILLTFSFYYFNRQYLSPQNSLWLSIIFIFLPARLLVLRQIGAPETWFISFILLSLTFHHQKKIYLSAIFASLAVLFKSPGIILFATYGLYFLYQTFLKKKVNLSYLWYLIVVATILGIFRLYQYYTGNFWAYFNTGDNIHLSWLPFQVFLSQQTWVNTIWLEDIIYIFIFAIFACIYLLRQYHFSPITIFPILYTLATIFVGHRDISRYISPVYPFILLAFHRLILSRQFRLILLLVIPAIILYSINFISGNIDQISNWAPFL